MINTSSGSDRIILAIVKPCKTHSAIGCGGHDVHIRCSCHELRTPGSSRYRWTPFKIGLDILYNIIKNAYMLCCITCIFLNSYST